MKNIAIIAPSGNIKEKEKLNDIKVYFESKNMKAEIFPSCYKDFRYMAGDDSERVKDIHDAYLDKNTDTIICLRGGYGTLRLLDKIDYTLIKNNPKKIVGSSDITNLLISIYKNTGQITYHGKMALNGVLDMNEKEFEKYKNAVENNIYDSPLKSKGIFWGGNLATLVTLFGSDSDFYIPNSDITLFIEDINEPTYKIDRMLTQILRNKALSAKIKGVIFGEFIGADVSLNEVLIEFAKNLKVPYVFDKRITHGPLNIIVPVGKENN